MQRPPVSNADRDTPDKLSLQGPTTDTRSHSTCVCFPPRGKHNAKERRGKRASFEGGSMSCFLCRNHAHVKTQTRSGTPKRVRGDLVGEVNWHGASTLLWCYAAIHAVERTIFPPKMMIMPQIRLWFITRKLKVWPKAS